MRIPSDREILEFIYRKYYNEFSAFSRDDKNRAVKIYVPISTKAIATHFRIDEDIIFGRLYYYLDEKYRYRNDDNSLVYFFSLSVGDDKHCINFPLMSSVLAGLQEDNSKFWVTTTIAIYATIIAILSIIISIFFLM